MVDFNSASDNDDILDSGTSTHRTSPASGGSVTRALLSGNDEGSTLRPRNGFHLSDSHMITQKGNISVKVSQTFQAATPLTPQRQPKNFMERVISSFFSVAWIWPVLILLLGVSVARMFLSGKDGPTNLNDVNNFSFSNFSIIAQTADISVMASQTFQDPLAPKEFSFKMRSSSSPHFIGREDQIQRLQEIFQQRDILNLSRRSCVLVGLGGIGKTQIMLRFIEKNSDLFSGIYWIDATSTETIEASIITIASSPAAQAAGVKQSVSSILQWLSFLQHEWLLVFDGADHEPHFLNAYLPGNNRGNILISSRNPNMRRITTSSLEILDMNEDEAISLLLLSAELNPNSSTARTLAAPIAQELSFMPLALDQAGAAIASGVASVDEYLSLYRKHRLELSEDRYFKDQYDQALYTTWDISFQEIIHRSLDRNTAIGKQSAIAVLILRVIAFLHFENIPEDLFARAATSDKEDFSIEESNDWAPLLEDILSISHDGKWNPLIFRGGVQALRSFSFLKSISGTTLYTMPRLVQEWVRDRMSDKERHQIIPLVSSLFKCSIGPLRNDIPFPYAFYRIITPHITSSQELIQKLYPAYEENDDALLRRLGTVMYMMGLSQQALQYYSAAVEIQTAKFGAQHPNTFASMINLALIFKYMGDHEHAKKLQEQVLKGRKRILGAEHPDTLISMNDLAVTLGHMGDYKHAKKLQEQVLEGLKQVLGAEHPDTFTSMNDLAMTFRAMGEYKKAKELLVQALEGRKLILGAQHPDTFKSMGDLALTLCDMGEYVQARELQEQELEESKRIKGAEHRDTLTSMNNLAMIFGDMGEYEKEEKLMVYVLEGQKRILGAEHPDIFMIMNNLALAFKKSGKFEQAKKLQEQALEGQKQILGDEHPNTLASMNNLALICGDVGEYKEAEKLLVQALKGLKRVLGVEHPHTLSCMDSLSWIHNKLEKGMEEKGVQLQCTQGDSDSSGIGLIGGLLWR